MPGVRRHTNAIGPPMKGDRSRSFISRRRSSTTSTPTPTSTPPASSRRPRRRPAKADRAQALASTKAVTSSGTWKLSGPRCVSGQYEAARMTPLPRQRDDHPVRGGAAADQRGPPSAARRSETPTSPTADLREWSPCDRNGARGAFGRGRRERCPGRDPAGGEGTPNYHRRRDPLMKVLWRALARIVDGRNRRRGHPAPRPRRRPAAERRLAGAAPARPRLMRVGVLGVGAVGARAVRQLATTTEPPELCRGRHRRRPRSSASPPALAPNVVGVSIDELRRPRRGRAGHARRPMPSSPRPTSGRGRRWCRCPTTSPTSTSC